MVAALNVSALKRTTGMAASSTTSVPLRCLAGTMLPVNCSVELGLATSVCVVKVSVEPTVTCHWCSDLAEPLRVCRHNRFVMIYE